MSSQCLWFSGTLKQAHAATSLDDPSCGQVNVLQTATDLPMEPTAGSASKGLQQGFHGGDVASVDGIPHQHGRGGVVDVLVSGTRLKRMANESGWI